MGQFADYLEITFYNVSVSRQSAVLASLVSGLLLPVLPNTRIWILRILKTFISRIVIGSEKIVTILRHWHLVGLKIEIFLQLTPVVTGGK